MPTRRGQMPEWSDIVTHAQRLGPDCFMATVTPDGDPHLAVVSPGFTDDLLVVATWGSSVKARNLRAGSSVMFHWVVREETGNDMLLVRGDANLVSDPGRSLQLWESDLLPYDPTEWYSGADDPALLWIEVTPTYASLHRNLGVGDSSTWRVMDPPSGDGGPS